MAELFLQLSKRERGDALGVAAEKGRRPAYLLEKDVWVVWALSTMFGSTFGPNLVFKGGTSLSKAYSAITRFSEDIDLTYDIRAIVPELVREGDTDGLPRTKSQQKRWRETIDERLGKWVVGDVLPLIQNALRVQGLAAQASVDADSGDTIRIEYEHTSEGSGYVKPVVVLEFGAKSTGEPCDPIDVNCDAAAYRKMLDDGLVWEPANPFEEIVRRCRDLEARVNAAMKG